MPPDSFGTWLRKVNLRKDGRVFLYNGKLKDDQSVQFAVLDISVGRKDLQQCADALIRLRAEYLYSSKQYSRIVFHDNAGKAYSWSGGNDRAGFYRFLETVFGYCGSASLEKELHQVSDNRDVQPGDVWIKGGFPGHAMIVMDVAANARGERIYLLAQSYMPAQDIHVVRNPANDAANPWYKADGGSRLITPQWTFSGNQLKRW